MRLFLYFVLISHKTALPKRYFPVKLNVTLIFFIIFSGSALKANHALQAKISMNGFVGTVSFNEENSFTTVAAAINGDGANQLRYFRIVEIPAVFG